MNLSLALIYQVAALVVALLVVGVLVVSTRIIGEDESGLVIKRFGRPLPSGRIIALEGEAGYQARMLPPGWHFGMWRWRYKVLRVPLVVVQPGEIATVVAADGDAIPADRVLAREVPCDRFQDAEAFLRKGGERGRQIALLTAGTYRLTASAMGFQTAVSAGVVVETDLGPWEVVLTPGHAPSHVCLWQPERRVMISGDHLLGRVSPYYDYGYSPDPAGEFLTSLDRVEALDARLCLSGHGRTFGDVQGHIAANRALVGQRLAALEHVLREDGAVTAFDAVPRVFGEAMTPMNANWWLSETLCYLRHLQVTGRAESDGASPERWRLAA